MMSVNLLRGNMDEAPMGSFVSAYASNLSSLTRLLSSNNRRLPVEKNFILMSWSDEVFVCVLYESIANKIHFSFQKSRTKSVVKSLSKIAASIFDP